MTILLKHAKTVAKSDGLDVTVVQPSDWNADHTLTATQGKVLGTPIGSTTVAELPITVDSTLQAMTPPSGPTASRPATPTTGMFRHNSTTGLLEAYLNGAWGALDTFPAGTRMLFQQTSAPTGWTKDTTQNDKALRVVSGAVGSGGTYAFSTAFSNRTSSSTTVSGTIGGTALSEAQIPPHRHWLATNSGSQQALGANSIDSYVDTTFETDYILKGNTASPDAGLSGYTGSGAAHDHPFYGSAHTHTLDMTVQYVDIIIAQKN